MKKIIALLILLPSISFGSTITTTIAKILFWDGGNLIYVYPKLAFPANAPSCHGSNGDYYSFSISRSMGKEYLSGLLSAQARKAKVVLYGKGVCSDQSNSETLNYFTIIE